jgi:hypothetical protein
MTERLLKNNFHKRIFGKLFGDKGFIDKDLLTRIYLKTIY